MRQAHTLELDVDRAVAAITEQVDAQHASVNLLFCAPGYDLERLGRAIELGFSTPVIACTSVGHFGKAGFQDAGITAISLASDELHVSPYLVTPLAECQARASDAAFKAMSGMLERGNERAFGLVLVDGLSGAEERLAASLYQSLGTIPLVGGSAGDELREQGWQGGPNVREAQRTHVYHQGRFLRDAAVFALFETTLAFTTFKVSHVVPGKHKLVVTMADPEQRVVQEFNGEPAAEAFAEALGLEVEELNSSILSANPLLFLSGGEHYVRSIRGVNDDHSLTLYGALEVGLVLTVGNTGDPIAALDHAFGSVQQKIGVPQVIIGCDSVLRRFHLEQDGTDQAVADWLVRHQVAGFSGYGEQYNAMYVNQTLSAVALSAE